MTTPQLHARDLYLSVPVMVFVAITGTMWFVKATLVTKYKDRQVVEGGGKGGEQRGGKGDGQVDGQKVGKEGGKEGGQEGETKGRHDKENLKPELRFARREVDARMGRPLQVEFTSPAGLKLTTAKIKWSKGEPFDEKVDGDKLTISLPTSSPTPTNVETLTLIETDAYKPVGEPLTVRIFSVPKLALPQRIKAFSGEKVGISLRNGNGTATSLDVSLRIGKDEPVKKRLELGQSEIMIQAPQLDVNQVSSDIQLELLENDARDYDIVEGRKTGTLIVSWPPTPLTLPDVKELAIREGTPLEITVTQLPLPRPLRINYRLGDVAGTADIPAGNTRFAVTVPSDGVPLVDRVLPLVLNEGEGYEIPAEPSARRPLTLRVEDTDPLNGKYLVAFLPVPDAMKPEARNTAADLALLRQACLAHVNAVQVSLCAKEIFFLSPTGWSLGNAPPPNAQWPPETELTLETIAPHLAQWAARRKAQQDGPQLVLFWPHLNRDLRVLDGALDKYFTRVGPAINGDTYKDFLSRGDLSFALLGSAGNLAPQFSRFWTYPKATGHQAIFKELLPP